MANAADREEIARRLCGIGSGSKRRWGKMSVAEMICHSSDALLVAMGERKAATDSNWFTRSAMKWAGLWGPMKWPHGRRTVPECEAGHGAGPSKLPRLKERRDRVMCHVVVAPNAWGETVRTHHERATGCESRT